MSENAVREQLQRYVESITPVQLRPFTGVAERRRSQRVRRAAAVSSVVLVAVAVVVAALLGGGSTTTITARPTPSPTEPSVQTATELAHALIGARWHLAAVDGPGTYWRSRSGSDASLSFGATDFT